MKSRFVVLLSLFFILITLHRGNAQARLKIDEERKGVDYFDKKGFELSEKFKKMDKSYYIGYMYEGSYKFNRATDYYGFKNAIKPLEKALELLEKDYDYKIKLRTNDLRQFIEVYQYKLDYSWISNLLYNCYSNIEEPYEAVKVLQRLNKKRFQKDLYCQPYINLSWVTHRNRFHTSDKYPFLKNSIEANELTALKYLDSAVANIYKNAYLNSQIYPPGHEFGEMIGVYHNKSLIYSYNFEMDSAEYYYDLLRPTGYLSNNNYAYTKLMNGEFENAIHYFDIEKKTETFREKSLKEFFYMLALLNTYKAKPQDGIKDLKEVISKVGSTPGFGWYNLGLARGYYYNGQLFESQEHLKKANEFEEMHIGTTWSPEQYDFTENIFSYLNKERKLQSIPFEDKKYWFNIPVLIKMAGFFIDEQSDKFLLINKFGANPERDYVYYHIFSPENMETFDETWKIIDGLDADFFIKKFNTYLAEDKRDNIKRYYKYFIARLFFNKGMYNESEKLLLDVLKDQDMEVEYEKMLQARCYETLCKIYKKNDNKTEYKRYLLAFYSTYPQLVPFSGNTMTFNLELNSSANNEDVKKVLDELYNCKINFLTPETRDSDYPTATLNFEKIDGIWQIDCKVSDSNGNKIADQESFKVDSLNGSGKRIGYYLFNIPATTIPDYGKNNYWIVAAVLVSILLLWLANRVKKSLKF